MSWITSELSLISNTTEYYNIDTIIEYKCYVTSKIGYQMIYLPDTMNNLLFHLYLSNSLISTVWNITKNIVIDTKHDKDGVIEIVISKQINIWR